MPQKVLSHFKKHDPILYAAIVSRDDIDTLHPESKSDLFSSLCRTIVGQQLSGKAADAIWNKFRALFPRNKPTVKHLLSLTEDELRSSGISYAKIRSVKDLSAKVCARKISLPALQNASEDTIREQLQTIVGVGPWTSEMFLMFTLGHQDVFSPGDLGLRKGIQKVYGLDNLPTAQEMEALSLRWSPYRTYASLALWHVLDNR